MRCGAPHLRGVDALERRQVHLPAGAREHGVGMAPSRWMRLTFPDLRRAKKSCQQRGHYAVHSAQEKTTADLGFLVSGDIV